MKNYGLLEELRELGAYVLGGSRVPFIKYLDEGDWERFLPKFEPQALHGETNGCTVWGSLNQIEIFLKGIYDKERNYAEQFTYLLTPVNPSAGADPQKAYECIRKYGLVRERYLDDADNMDDFFAESRLTDRVYEQGRRWLQRYFLNHEWLWGRHPGDNQNEVIRRALTTSPIGVSVTAWIQNDDDKYVDGGIKNNHWCVCYKIDDEGIHVFDSYDNSKKILSHDHYIHRAKRIWINRLNSKSNVKKQITILSIMIKILEAFRPIKKTFLDYCNEAIGTDVTPDDFYPDVVACAITLTTLVHKTDATFPRVAGTWTLWDILEHRSDYERVTVPSPGTLVVSPTGTGNGSIPGHAGVFMDDYTIASNDSATGKFMKNYTLDTWRKRYVDKGGFKVFMYKLKV